MPYVITKKTTHRGHDAREPDLSVDRHAVATLDERALLRIADAAAEASPDTGEGGAWHMRSDAVREMRYDLDRIDEGDLSDWKDGVTADEARACCRANLERWIAEWTGWIPSESGGTIVLPDGTEIEVAHEKWSTLADDLNIELRWDPPIAYDDYLHDRQRDELLGVIDAYNAAQEA